MREEASWVNLRNAGGGTNSGLIGTLLAELPPMLVGGLSAGAVREAMGTVLADDVSCEVIVSYQAAVGTRR